MLMDSPFATTTWEEYRRWRKWSLILTLLFPPGVTALSVPLVLLLQSEIPAFAIAFAWGAAVFWVSLRPARHKCPRCGEMFFKSWYTNTFTKRCLNCGLKKWEIYETEDSVDDHR